MAHMNPSVEAESRGEDYVFEVERVCSAFGVCGWGNKLIYKPVIVKLLYRGEALAKPETRTLYLPVLEGQAGDLSNPCISDYIFILLFYHIAILLDCCITS